MNSLEEIKEHIYSTHTTRCRSYEAIAALDIKTKRVNDICIPISWAICVDNDFFYYSSDFKELKKFLNSFYYDLIIWTYWLGGLYYNLPQEIFGENPEINTGGNGQFFPKEIRTKNRLIFRDSRELSKMTLEDMGAQLGFSSTVNSVAIICKWISLLKDLIGVEKVSQLPISQGKLYRTKVEFSKEFNKNGYIATLSQSQMRYQDGKGIWKDEKTYEKFHNGFRNGLITRDTSKDGKKIKNILYADITSAFPAVMYTKKFPWAFTKINMVGAKDPSFFFSCYRHPTKERCFFGKFTFTNLALKREAPCATVVENTEFVVPAYSGQCWISNEHTYTSTTTTVECTGISLNNSNLTFTTGATQTLSATVTPTNCTQTVTWSSNATGVATVSNGVVTPVSNGTATITATCGSYSATCTVTVSLKTLSSISAVYTQGSSVVYPSTSLNDLKSNLAVTATYSDNTAATITDYTLSGTLTVGNSTVTVTYSGKTTTFNVTVSEESTTTSYVAGYYNDSGTLMTAEHNYVDNNYISVNGGEVYNVNTTVGVENIRFNEYDSSKNFIKRQYGTADSTGKTWDSFTTGSNTAYVRVGFVVLETNDNEADLETLFSNYSCKK